MRKTCPRLFSARALKFKRLQFRQLLAERLEPRELLAVWHNSTLPADVDGDGEVSPTDALMVIDRINAPVGSLTVGTVSDVPPPYLDVSGDGLLDPGDALIVINAINASSPNVGAAGDGFAGLAGLLSTPAQLGLVALQTGSTTEQLVNTKTKEVQEMPAVATSAAGTVIVWSSLKQDGSDWGVYGQRFDTSGNKVGGEFRVNVTTKYAQRAPKVAMFEDGRFVVAWEGLKQGKDDGWGVYVRIFNTNGTPATGEMRVNESQNGTQRYPSVAVLNDGTFAVAWEGKGTVNSSLKEAYEVWVRRFSSSGTPLSSQQRVNVATEGVQERTAIAALPEGGFAIVWNGYGAGDAAGVYLRRYDASGAPAAGESLVNTEFRLGDQRHAAIAVSPSGQMLVAWASTHHQLGWGVYGQLLGADGSPVEGEILVNQTLVGTQWNPSVAAIGDESYVVAWEGFSKKDEYSIYTRRVTSGGQTSGDEKIMSQKVKGIRRNTAMAGAQSSYVIAWDGLGPGDKFGIFSQGTGGGTSEPVNDPPVNRVPGTQTVSQDQVLVFSAAGQNAISVSDPDAAADDVQVSLVASAGTLTLSTSSGLDFSSGDGSADTAMTFTGTLTEVNAALAGLQFAPPAGFTGVATVGILTNDLGHNGTGGAKSDSDTVAINVQGTNQPPTFTLAANPPAVNEDAGNVAVNSFATNISPGAGDPNQILTFTLSVGATAGNLTFATEPAIDGNGRLTYTPSANTNGTATVSVVLRDNSSNVPPNSNTSTTQTFTISVNSVNDAPSFTIPNAPAVNEDAGAVTVNNFASSISAGPSDEAGQLLTFSLVASGTTGDLMFSTAPAIDSSGRLTYTPAPNANGSASFTVVLSDNGASVAPNVNSSASRSFTITVNPVNDVPSFVKGPDQISGATPTLRTVPGWAKSISAGPPNESSQSLTFHVTTSNNAFFSTLPAISPTGTLTFAPAADVRGSVTVTVRLKDGGGTTNGGVDLSAPQTFTISVGEFDDNLTGWTVSQTGGSETGKGGVTAQNGVAKIIEGDSFTVTLSKPFTVSATPAQLTFEYDDLIFDTASTGLINDAFEATFVNDQGLPLVPTFTPGRDAFFNITQGQSASLGSGVTVEGTRVTVDLSGVAAGTTGRLVLRLVNNDTDVTTSVLIFGAWLSNAPAMPFVGPLFANSLNTNSNGGGPSSNSTATVIPNITYAGVPSLPSRPASTGSGSSTPTGGSVNSSSLPVLALADLPASALAVDSRGTDFWLGFNSNLHEGNNSTTLTLFITSDVATTGVVEIPGITPPFSQPFAVNPGEVVPIVLPPEAEVRTVSLIEQKGIHVTANDDVTVYGLNREQATTDAFLALPTSALGQDYMNLTYRNSSFLLAFVAGTQMLVVGTEDDTSVTIAPGPYSQPTRDSNVSLRDSQNAERFNLRNGNDGGPFVINPGGNFTLSVSPPAQSYAGNYKFRFLDLAVDSTAVAFNQTVTGTFAFAQETRAFRFNGTAGQKIILDGLTGGFNRSQMRLISPTGVQLDLQDSSSDSGFITLPETSQYYLLMNGIASAPTDFGFRIVDKVSALPLTLGATTTGTFPTGNETFLYEFEGQAGQQIYYDSLITGRYAGITIYGPGGGFLQSNNLADDRDPIVLPTTGTYLVSVAAGFAAPNSPFSFRLLDVAAAPLVAFDTVTTGQLTNGKQTTLFRFQGTPGQFFLYDGLQTTGAAGMRLFDPSRALVTSAQIDGDSNPIFLNQSGTYVLAFDGIGNTANFSFRLLDASAGSQVAVGASSALTIEADRVVTVSVPLIAGREYTFDALSPFSNAAVLNIYDPRGTGVASRNATGDYTFTATQTGPYYFAFTNFTSAQANVQFRVIDLSAATALTLDADTTATFAAALETVAFEFNGTVGQRLIFDSLSAGATTGLVALTGPGGRSVFSTNFSGDSDPFTIAEPGVYTLQLQSSASSAGAVQFRMQNLANVPTVAFGGPTTVTGSPQRMPVYQFNGTAGQRVLFDNTSTGGSTGTWTLYGPGNRVLDFDQFANDLSVDLPQTGQYILLFEGTVNTLTFQSTLTTPPTVAPSGFDTEQTLTITAGQQANYTFTAPVGLVFALDGLANVFQNIRVLLLSPSGQTLADTNDAADAGPFVALESGQYTLRLQGFNDTQTGDYRFRLLDMTNSAASISLAAVQEAALDLPSGAKAFKFTASAGQRIHYDPLKVDFQNVGATIIGPDGSFLISGNVDQSLITQPLVLSGTHYVLVENNAANTSGYKFRLLEETASPALTLGTAASGNLDAFEADIYTFTAAAGQQLFFDGTDNDFDNVEAQLVGPGEDLIFNINADDDFGPFAAPTAGQYRLRISSSQASTVDYSFKLSEFSPTTVPIGTVTSGDLGPLGRNAAFYQFNGTAGQTIYYDGIGGNFDNVRIALRDPTGRQLHENNADFDSGLITLPKTGAYSIVIRGFGGANAPFAFRVVDAVSATAITAGSTVTGTLANGGDTAMYRFTAAPGDVFLYSGINSDTPQARVDVYDANLNLVLSRNNVRDDGLFTAATGGSYFLFVRGGQEAPVDFSFVLHNASAAPEIVFGVDTTGTLPTGQSHAVFRIDAAAGQRIYYDGLGNNDDNVFATLFSPAFGFVRNANSDRDFGILTLGESGEYYLVLNAELAAGADFSFRLLDVADAPQIQFGQVTTSTLPSRYADLFRVSAAPPGTATFDNQTLSASGAGATWQLFDPENALAGNASLPQNLVSRILFGGEYVLAFFGASAAGAINYSFQSTFVADAPVTPAGLGVLNELEIPIHGQATANFSIPAGRLVYFDAALSDFAIPTHTITLDAGETYQVRDELGSNDMTGATVTSNKPVAVFGSHVAAFIPGGFGFADHLVEQLPPTSSWGREFVTMPLATRLNGDTFRFLAATDGTIVRVNGTQVATIDRGEFHELRISNPSQITSNHPILVAQYSNSSGVDGVTSDPFMLYIPPYEQFLANYTVTTPATGFTNYINIVAPTAAIGDVSIDGTPIAANLFTAIGTSGFSGTQLQVAQGSHQLNSTFPFGAFMYGFATFDSYGYAGGQSLAPVALAESIALSPDGVTVAVGTSQTVSATVLDADGQPVAGVRVDFQVSGANPGQGFDFTDDAGIARFTYVGNVEGTDVIQATVSDLVDEATLIWEDSVLAPPTISLLSPANGSSVAAGQSIVASGFVTADSPSSVVSLVTVNGVPVDALDAAGNFFVRLLVGPGENNYQFTVEDSSGQTASTMLTLVGDDRPEGTVEFASLSDVSGSFRPIYARTSFDDAENILFADTAIENVGQYPTDAPLFVAIANISDPTVLVLDSDGTTPSGVPYYDFSGMVTGGTLAPRGQTGFLSAAFLNPNGVRFTYDLVFFGQLNDAPVIGSLPRLEAFPTKSYSYDVLATDPNGHTLRFELAQSPAGMSIDANTGALRWTPQSADLGTHDVLIRVSDGRGGIAEQRYTLAVVVAPPNRPPLFTTLPPTIAFTGSPYAYDAAATDPDDDTLTFTLIDPPTGVTMNTASGLISWQPSPAQVGNVSITLQVADGRGGTAQQTFTVCVLLSENRQPPPVIDLEIVPKANNADPRFTSTPPALAQAGVQLRYLPTAVDADDTDLTFDAPLAPPGSTVDAVTGELVWTPLPGDVGQISIVLRVRDGHGGLSQQSFSLTVSPANTPPVINTTPPLTAVAGAAWQYAAGAQDADGDALTFVLTNPPAGMSIAPATGVVSWTPNAAQVGTQSVSITVSDGRGGIATQMFGVVVVATGTNQQPVISSAPRTSIPIGREFIYAPQATDPDANPLTYSLENPPAGMTINSSTGVVLWTPVASQLGGHTATLRVSDGQTSVTQQLSIEVTAIAANGPPQIVSTPTVRATVQGRDYAYDLVGSDPDNDPLTWRLVSGPAGMSVDPLRGTLRWTPTPEQIGPQTVKVEVSDTFAATDTQSFVISCGCANLPPAIVSAAPTEVASGRRYLYAVRAIDPEQDAITFSLPTAPAGMSIDENGVIRWQPTAQQLGPFEVVVRVTDIDNAVGEHRFTVTVTQTPINNPPYFTSRPGFRATLTEEYRYQAMAIDPEGTAVTYSLIAPPAGMTINPTTGLLTWTPSASQGGAYIIKIAADDPTGARGVQSFALLARANSPPTITSTAITTVMAGETYLYDVRATDLDNDPLSFTLQTAPPGMAIDELGRIVWQTSEADLGPHSIAVIVTDSHGDSGPQSFTLTVSPDTTAPVVRLTASSPRVAVGGDVVITVLASDNVGVALRTLTVGGQTLTLDANGTAVFQADALGVFPVQATATDVSGNVGTASLSLRVYDPTDANGPQVTITSPTPNAAISQLTDVVGTVTDTNLAFYSIQYARADLVNIDDPQADDPDYVTFATGTQNVSAATLGSFDPTLLLNDSYVLRVIAEDASGNVAAKVLPISVQGALKLGNYAFSIADLAIPLAGIPIQVVRTYNTLSANEQGDFGFGWKLGFQDADIRETVAVTQLEFNGVFFAANPFRLGARVYLTNPEGRRVGFTFDPVPQFSLFGGGYFLPRFIPDPGVTDKLEVDPTPLQNVNGSFNISFLGFPYNPSLYKLTTKQGVTYDYDQFNGLQKITNRDGETLTFSPDGIVSSLGSRVDFVRDPLGRISRVVDPTNHSIEYEYDAAGNLVSVTDQEDLTTTYEYLTSPAHYLESITDPDGILVLAAEYDAAGRIIGTRDAAGNLQTNSYDVAGATEVLADPLGKTTTVKFDARGNVIESLDPLGNATKYTYDGNDNLISLTDARGFTSTQSFDSRGNLTSLTNAQGKIFTAVYDASSQLQSATDPLGRAITLTYDEGGNLLSFVNAEGSLSSFTYDDQSRPLTSTDNLGNVTIYEYGTGPRPSRARFADGSQATFEYNAFGLVTRQVDENGNETRFTYDDLSRVTSQTDALGGTTLYVYEGTTLASSTDALGRITRYEYDDQGRLVRIIDPRGGVAERAFNASNQVVTEINALGGITSYKYGQNRLLSEVTDPRGGTTRYEYDKANNLVAVTNAQGYVTRFEIDSLGRLTAVTDALNGVQRFDYDDAGRQISYTDARNNISRYEYDSLNQVVRNIDPLGNTRSQTYDGEGNPLSFTDKNGNVTRFEYDERQRKTKAIDPLGEETAFDYDAAGNLLSTTDALGRVTALTYDKLNRISTRTDALGAKLSFTYDAVGNITKQTDELGRSTLYVYDAKNFLISDTNALGGVTLHERDLLGNVTALRDPLGSTTRSVYDAASDLVSRTDPAGNATTFAHDVIGNLTQTTDRNGRTRQFTYDALDRRTQERWLTGSTIVETLTFAFDADGNLTGAAKANSQYAFTYDANDQQTSASNAGTPGFPSITLQYGYDPAGNVVSVTDNQGTQALSTYDARHALTSRTWQGGGVTAARVDWIYNAVGQATTATRFADLAGEQKVGTTAYEYDAVNHLTAIRHKNAVDAVLAEYEFDFDLAGQITGQLEHGELAEFGYDLAGQLKTADYSGQPDDAFVYDANGNRLGPQVQVNLAGQIISDAEFDYQYDAEGNLTRKTERATQIVTTLAYDHRNQLTAIEARSAGGIILSSVGYTYDVFGRQITRTENGQIRRTVYDGAHAWADFDAAGNLAARYLFSAGTDQLLARYRPNDGLSWYLIDRLGSVEDILNNSGAIIDTIKYDAFGQVVSETNPAAGDRFKFTGRELDTTTGLYYYRARVYDPGQGRFLNQDPLSFYAGDTNLYRYVQNKPLQFTDPSGLQPAAEYTLNIAGHLGGRYGLIKAMADFGGDSPYTLTLKGTSNGLETGFTGNFQLSHDGMSIGFGVSGNNAVIRGSGTQNIGGFKIPYTFEFTTPLPDGSGEAEFLFTSTSTARTFPGRFFEAAAGLVAVELELFAKYLAEKNAQKLIETRIEERTLNAYAFTTATQFVQVGAPYIPQPPIINDGGRPTAFNFTPQIGIQDVAFHGGEDCGDVDFSPEQLIQVLLRFNVLRGTPLRLISCYLGNNAPFVAELARLWGSSVTVSTGLISGSTGTTSGQTIQVNSNGTVVVVNSGQSQP